MTRKIDVRVYARRRDGTPLMRNGRHVNVWKRVPVVDRLGPWVITPYVFGDHTVARWFYVVTHAPTGWFTHGGSLTLAQARRAMKAFAALPNQAAWKRLKNSRHMTTEMKAAGNALVKKLRGGA